MKDRDALILTLWGECRGEPWIGQVCVACVIRNRLNDSRWPDTWESVCRQPKQFSCWNDTEPLADATHPLYQRLAWIADGIMKGDIPDLSMGANHYLNAFARPSEPSWAWNTGNITVWPGPLVGRHAFYKL